MIGHTIKHFREKKGLSQADLAIHVGTTQQTISNWEKGSGVPDAYEVIKIAEAFKVGVKKLLEFDPTPTTPKPVEV